MSAEPALKGGTACSPWSLRPPFDPHAMPGQSPAIASILQLRGLTKRYKAFTLDGASLAVQPGTMMGLLGPKGAGKTTLIKAILGLVRLDGGSALFQGRNLASEGPELRRRIAYVADEPKFAPGARLATLKEVYAPFYPDFDEARWRGLMADFGLDPKKKAKELSLGQRSRFALTLALSRDWDLMVLDEPTTGLDPVFRRELIQRFSERLDERRAILFSTHITSDLEGRADHVTFLRNGQVVLSDTQDSVKERWGLVKGGLELLESPLGDSAAGGQHTEYGVTLLCRKAGDPPPADTLLEKPRLEDLLYFHGRELTSAPCQEEAPCEP